jgi:hypothetical protein
MVFRIGKYNIGTVLCLLFFYSSIFADNWSFKLKSKVELRTWKLSAVAMKSATFLNGATVKLYNGSSVVSQTTSDAEGNFEMNIPHEGNYTLEITYPGCSLKKFTVNTKGVSNGDANFKPSVDIVGMMASKYTTDGKYLGLDQTHIKIEHHIAENTSKVTTGEAKPGYNFKLNSYDAEYLHIQRFCTANKLGDRALNNKNYALAKKFYLMAMDRIGEEEYPKDRLKVAEEGLKMEKESKENARQKQTSVKITPKKTITSSPAKKTDVKKSSDGDKARRKIRTTL